MPVLSAELVGEQGELRDRFLNHGLCGTVDIQAIVIHPLDRKSVESRASATNRATGTLHATLLRRGAWSEYRELFDVAADGVHRQIVDDLSAEGGAQFGGFGLHQFGAGFDFHDGGDVSDFQYG